MKKIKFLEKFYYYIVGLNFILIILTSHIISDNLVLFNGVVIKEEYFESIIIVFLFLIFFVISWLYKKEVEKNREALEEAFKYIGKLNVQMQEIENALGGVDKIPENKREYKNVINYFSKKILAIINVDWVLFRILDIESLQTLREKVISRGNTVILKYEISNKKIANHEKIDKLQIIASKQNNLGVKAYLVFPENEINKKDRAVLINFLNQLEMMFVIYSAKYFSKKI